MNINAATESRTVQQSATLASRPASIGQNLPSAASNPETSNEIVTISDEAKSRFEGALGQVSGSSQLHGGYEGMIGLGLMALGGQDQLDQWRDQGLEITEETVLAAAKEFQDGFKEFMDKRESSAQGLTLNRHQMVMNAQNTPEWFKDEYSNLLSMMEDGEAKKAFEEGATSHV